MNVIGVDVGGTKVEGVLVNRKHTVLERKRVKTPRDASIDVVYDTIAHVINSVKNDSVVGIGIGTPGFILPTGAIASVDNIPCLRGSFPKAEMKKRVSCPLFFENDANCFALAEWKMGAGKGKENVIGVTLGTGMGVGLILGGRLYRGTQGGAGELNHSFMDVTKTTRFYHHVESIPVVERFNAHGKERIKGICDLFSMQGTELSLALDDYYNHLALALSHIINLLNPEMIVFGGGVSKSIDLDKLYVLTQDFVYPTFKDGFTFAMNALGDSAGVIGAALLVKNQ